MGGTIACRPDRDATSNTRVRIQIVIQRTMRSLTQRRTILDWHGEQVGGGDMTSEPIRDPQSDHLLTPANSALVIIDYQPVQVGSIRSMDRDTLVANIVRVLGPRSLYRLPIVLTTVNVKTGANQPTIDQLH